MANLPNDRTNIGFRERPASGDLNRQSSQESATLRELIRMLLSPRGAVSQSGQASSMDSRSGLIADGLRIEAPGGMFVGVVPGHGFIYDPTDVPTDIGAPDLEGISDVSPFKPVSLNSIATFAVPAAPGGGLGRTDIIEIRSDRRLEDAVTRRQFDAGSTAFVDHIFSKTLAFSLDGQTGIVAAGGGNSTAALSYKIGTAAALTANGDRRDGNSVVTPPSVSPGYIKLGDIQVNNGTVTISQGDLNDRRPLLGPGGVTEYCAKWRLRWNGGSPLITVMAMLSPPGLRVSLRASAARSSGIVAVTGGEIITGAMNVKLSFPGNTGGSTVCIGETRSTTNDGEPSTISGSTATALDSAFPPHVVGGKSRAIQLGFKGYFMDGSVVNDTDTDLEDVYVTASGWLGY